MGIDSNNRAGSGAAYSRFAEEMDIDSVNLSMRGPLSKSQGLKGFCLNNWKTLIVLLIAILCFGIGIILGHFIASSCVVKSSTNGIHKNETLGPDMGSATMGPTTSATSSSKPDYLAMINGLIQTSSLQANLRTYTNGPHHAGSQGNLDLAAKIYDTWRGYGFDVYTKNYSVLLSRPSTADPNSIEMYNTANPTDKDSFLLELDDTDLSGMLKPFAVYGSNASITEDPVYVNFATTENFDKLLHEAGVNYAGHICLARMGRISLAQMAEISKDRGCIALVAFPDPNFYANPTSPANSFPNTWWLPTNAIPRESARLSMGDPSTPFFPSYDMAPRKPLTSVEDFPVQTISFATAKKILAKMANPPATEDWIIDAPEIFVGPGFHVATQHLRLNIYNTLSLTNITNVIATIPGTKEPDRYVIIGNHRDSFSQGVVSPGTGTACLMEVAKVLSELTKQGWRPRRTILLASWDAGEDGLIGSTEWVEENMEKLHSRGVAYINLDDAVTGNYSFAAAGSPLLADVIFNAAKEVNCPEQSHHNMSIYDDWASRRPISATNQKPQLDPLGKASDSAPFLMLAGVPSVDLQYTYDEKFYKAPKYPTYRTLCDKAENINLFIDPDFSIHAAVTEVAARVLVTLADTTPLSMKVCDYADALTRYMQDFKDQYGAMLQSKGIYLDELEAAVKQFSEIAESFQHSFDNPNENDELIMRRMNDHVMTVERAFLVNEGLPLNPESRHLIYSADVSSVYKGAAFGPLVQMMVMEQELNHWNYVEETLGYTVLGLYQATDILRNMASTW
ncbi:putative N-acetylated-alpha-linked acidic dipeptidase [Patiria miniata]|uniref:Uncharacterized protein n=1 Tax=Patiria miniata TaxID=46514 RepID=A0A914BNG6_PATMI|nr:putative N-acetylated-alpha-linked acidic dipeptidase [Patiria miniata]